MAGPGIGYATLQVIPSMKGVGASMASQVKGPAAAAGTTAGTVMGTAMKGAMAGALVGIGAIAGLAKLGGSFDEAFDTIRVGTGATGEALDGLKGSLKNVFGSLPTDMGSAGTAIADLNTRLGLTGSQLETSASQFLELSRITGTDLSGNITAVTRAFGDWGVSAERQEASLDSLFRAAQASGATVDQLANGLVQFGSPLRQLGFSMGKSTALLAGFEQAGVNSELVMGSLRIALGKMAKEGVKDLPAALDDVMGSIKNAGTAGEGAAIALEVFGARAGPDMAAAIREGRFELGTIYDAIGEGTETIMGAAEDTNDWRESWERLRNQGFVLLEPIATRVFNLLGTGMDWLAEKAPIVAEWFGENMWPGIRTVGEFIGGAVSTGFALLSSWWADHGEAVTGGLKAIGETIGGAVSAGFEAMSNWWDTNGDTVLGGIRGIGDVINDPVIPAMEALRDWVKDEILPKLGDLFEFIKGNEYVLKVLLVGAIGAVTVAFWGWASAASAAAAASLAAMGAAVVAWLPFVLIGAAIAAVAAALWYAYENWGWFRWGVTLARLALENLYGVLQDVYELVDNALGKVGELIDKLGGLKIPGVSAGGGLGLDDLIRGALGGIGFRGFDTGGIVPGRIGEPQLALVHGGETILPTHKQDFDLTGSGGGRPIELHFNEVGDVDPGMVAATLAWSLARR